VSELPEGLGRFSAGDLEFVVDDGYSLVAGAERELDEQHLGARLPVNAPLASWLLARLAHLAAGSLALEPDVIEVCEGAVYLIDFVVRKDAAAVGKVQLQAGREGAALLGALSIDPTYVVDRLVEALLANPQDVAACRARARDPAWPEHRVVEYGYDGTRYF
jgi:hypothetical protein